ncbi:MAG TPA: type II/IV secretion system protein, partial [Burkholderiales bacterium]|nr:type II/IV secretion system protein [Burkholderiales bacterium]
MAAVIAQPERQITLPEILDELVADGYATRTDADTLIKDRRMHRGHAHPLIQIADHKLKNARPPHKLLHLEWLTEWFAGKTDLDYYHVDPLKINFGAVTELMSSAYAQRYKILPVELNGREAIVATAEPYIREWEAELSRMMRVDIKRVFANPADIN